MWEAATTPARSGCRRLHHARCARCHGACRSPHGSYVGLPMTRVGWSIVDRRRARCPAAPPSWPTPADAGFAAASCPATTWMPVTTTSSAPSCTPTCASTIPSGGGPLAALKGAVGACGGPGPACLEQVSNDWYYRCSGLLLEIEV